MRRLLPCLAFLVAGCGEANAPPSRAPAEPRAETPPEPAPPPEGKEAPAAGPSDTGEDAAATLRRYYAMIEAGDYERAWAMRDGDRAGLDRFRANFEAYETYRATVGEPSEPVTAGGWIWVEVPVMVTGRKRSGEPAGTVGSVSLRRAGPANAAATPDQRRWHIFTG